LDPKHYDFDNNLGFVLSKLGNVGSGLENLEEALQINPDSSEARFQLAAVLRSMGERDKAREELKLFRAKKTGKSRQETVARTKADQPINTYKQ